ncbi:hypothetical protein ACJX0J_012253, partial [Zea mays]
MASVLDAAQKECEDESTKIAFGNLRSEKDKILFSLRKKQMQNKLDEVTGLEKKLDERKKQIRLHRSKVAGLEKKLDEDEIYNTKDIGSNTFSLPFYAPLWEKPFNNNSWTQLNGDSFLIMFYATEI